MTTLPTDLRKWVEKKAEDICSKVDTESGAEWNDRMAGIRVAEALYAHLISQGDEFDGNAAKIEQARLEQIHDGSLDDIPFMIAHWQHAKDKAIVAALKAEDKRNEARIHLQSQTMAKLERERDQIREENAYLQKNYADAKSDARELVCQREKLREELAEMRDKYNHEHTQHEGAKRLYLATVQELAQAKAEAIGCLPLIESLQAELDSYKRECAALREALKEEPHCSEWMVPNEAAIEADAIAKERGE